MLEQIVLAGILYLIVVAIVLTIKPKFMFTEDGVWKEFGIGRNPATHTWMPFWLFSVLWALVCYILVSIVLGIFTKSVSSKSDTSDSSDTSGTSKLSVDVVKSTKGRTRAPSLSLEDDSSIPVVLQNTKYKARGKGKSMELPDGYYMLNADATEEAGGIPKYIFLGKGLPSDD